jgi:predicted nuclease of restriction endonuclease-like RecB superfamily
MEDERKLTAKDMEDMARNIANKQQEEFQKIVDGFRDHVNKTIIKLENQIDGVVANEIKKQIKQLKKLAKKENVIVDDD